MYKDLLFVCLLLAASSILSVRSVRCPEEERLALIEFVTDFHPLYEFPPPSWNISIDPCLWQSVQCDNLTGNVISFKLDSSTYRGKLSSSSSIFRLLHLQQLVIDGSDLQQSSISEAIGNLHYLTWLGMPRTNLTGTIPSALANLPYLQTLDLSWNDLTGYLPLGIFFIRSLQYLYLNANRLNGSIPSKLRFVSNLAELNLADNEISGKVPPWIFTAPSLETLDLSNNNFTGAWDPFPAPLRTSLRKVSMENNGISGSIPRNFFRHVSITDLNLGHNQLSGNIQWGLFKNMVNLTELRLLHNRGLRLSQATNESVIPLAQFVDLSFCNLTEFPEFLRATPTYHLNVSNNFISGRIFPHGEEWPNLYAFDGSHNLITGFDRFPEGSIFQFDLSFNSLRGALVQPTSSIHFLLLMNNQLTGEITQGFCNNLTNMEILDLSYNSLEGNIPGCVLNSTYLNVLNLQHNRLHGEIPHSFCYDLGFLMLNDNKLEGRLPPLPFYMEVLDLGNNMITDTFPVYGYSSRILILKSNNFYGEIGFPEYNSSLQILDISNNSFSGNIPWQLIQNLAYMITMPLRFLLLGKYVGSNAEYRGHRGGTYEVTWTTEVTMEGKTFIKRRVPYTLAIIDLSNNKFNGSIPYNMGILEKLKVLNVSRNNLTGGIPSSVGRMRNVKSLDLSYNKLQGSIPRDLVNLQVLEYLNLSYNLLEGRIPQLNSFSNASYFGNLGLCGTPLTKMC